MTADPSTETLFDALPVPAWIVDRHSGRLLAANAAALGLAPPASDDDADGSPRGPTAAGELEFRGVPARLVVARGPAAADGDRAEVERMRAELAAERARMAGVFRQAPGFICVLRGPEHVVEMANDAFLRLVGRDDVVGRPVRELMSGADEPPYLAPLAGVYSRAQRYEGAPMPLRISPPWGAAAEERWVAFTYQPVHGPEHEVTGIFVHGTDVTEPRRAAEELRHSEERFRLAARATNDVVWEWDLATGEMVWNGAMHELVGVPPEAVQTRVEWLESLMHPDDRERVVAGLRRAVEGGGSSWRDEYRLRRGDGRWTVVLDRGHLLRADDGRLVRMVGALADVTERKQVDLQLLQSQRLEAIGRLAGGVAHDFNNLLTAITGYTELLLADMPPGEAREDLLEIGKAAARATGLTRQLLAFSRRQVLQPQVLDMNATVRDLTTMLRRLLREDIELQVSLAEGLGSVRADPAQLEQVLLNLTMNARDAMPTGGTVFVGTRAGSISAEQAAAYPYAVSPGAYVVLSVRDTGAGIAPEVLPKIFEPFFTTKASGLGTGLGLSTVYGIVKQSGGYLWVESEPGKGATFQVYLPATDAPVEAPAGPAQAGSGPAGSGTVLLVEDNSAVRSLVRTVLTAAGYRVVEAADGAQALHAAATLTEAPDLLLTDVVMPRMSGRAVANEITRLYPGVPVLYMSGYTDDALASHGVLDPGVLLLEKPFTREALLARVREALVGNRE